ncbi:hypothetical protein A2702_02175 [Candidatus Amesbacteria bacterium RIFCSPHIGHO2_01_FULL_48_75]|nr:MAG: hypothetical protein A2V48_03750 [Candidatus Amesbacteria bacterium RBG_19FT_COMBO_48_16]OGC98746.1 MAG: hypothetical protein A2702_02175 [Candidatus Amesbacteria bacterium RIFCSPHIGHO2_01_FULL_48_75]
MSEKSKPFPKRKGLLKKISFYLQGEKMNHKRHETALYLIVLIALIFSAFSFISSPQPAQAAETTPNTIPNDGCGMYYRQTVIRSDGMSARITGQVINLGSTTCVGTLDLEVLEVDSGSVVNSIQIQINLETGESYSWDWEPQYSFEEIKYWVKAVVCNNGCLPPAYRLMNDRRDGNGMSIWIQPVYGICTMDVRFRNDPDYSISVFFIGIWIEVASGHLDVLPGSDWTDWITVDLTPYATYPASDLPVRVHAEWNETGSLPADEEFTVPASYMGCAPPPPPPPENQVPQCIAAADPSSGQAPLTVTLDGSNSSDEDGQIVSYEWNYDDGYTGSGETVPYVYEESGVFTAELTVTDDDGASSSCSVEITVGDSVPSEPPPPPPPVTPPVTDNVQPCSVWEFPNGNVITPDDEYFWVIASKPGCFGQLENYGENMTALRFSRVNFTFLPKYVTPKGDEGAWLIQFDVSNVLDEHVGKFKKFRLYSLHGNLVAGGSKGIRIEN